MRTHTRPRPALRPTLRPTPVAPQPGRSRQWRWVAGAVVLPVLLAGICLWYFVLRHDAPPIASLDQAVAGVQAPAPSADVASSTGSDPGTPTASTPFPVEGTWTIDTTITNAQGTGSYTGFRVNEVLAGVGSTTAVGRTPSVHGTLTVAGTSLTEATISADLTAVTSNDPRRDSAIQRALSTSRYPTATFVLTTPVEVGSVPAEGQQIEVSATGQLTIRGVTRQITIPLQAQLQNGVLVVIGTTEVSFADYGITAPSAPIVTSVEDRATIELQLYFTKN